VKWLIPLQHVNKLKVLIVTSKAFHQVIQQ
jgi:hypothetical protein